MNMRFKVLAVTVVASAMTLPFAIAQQSAIRGGNTVVDQETGAAVVTNAEFIGTSGVRVTAPQAVYVIDGEKSPRVIDLPRGATFTPADRSFLRIPSGTYYPELQTITATQGFLQRSSGPTIGTMAVVDITCRNGIIHEGGNSTGLSSACYSSTRVTCGGNTVWFQMNSRTCSIK